MATLAGFSVLVTSETPRFAVEVMQYPVESGINLTDHVEQQAVTLDIEGKVLGTDAATTRAKLIEIMRSGTIVSFTGRNAFTQALITSFESSHDNEVANGFNFTASLIQVRIATSSAVVSSALISSQTKAVTSAGRQQLANQPTSGPTLYTVRKGQTFSSIATKYGTTWQKVAALNPGINPTKLQIGQEIRIA